MSHDDEVQAAIDIFHSLDGKKRILAQFHSGYIDDEMLRQAVFTTDRLDFLFGATALKRFVAGLIDNLNFLRHNAVGVDNISLCAIADGDNPRRILARAPKLVIIDFAVEIAVTFRVDEENQVVDSDHAGNVDSGSNGERQFAAEAVEQADAVVADVASDAGNAPKGTESTPKGTSWCGNTYVTLLQNRIETNIITNFRGVQKILILRIVFTQNINKQAAIIAKPSIITERPFSVKSYFHGAKLINISQKAVNIK